MGGGEEGGSSVPVLLVEPIIETVDCGSRGRSGHRDSGVLFTRCSS